MFAASMPQGELGDRLDIVLADCLCATPCGMSAGCPQPDQIGTHTVDACGEATLGNQRQGLIIQLDALQAFTCQLAAFGQCELLRRPLRAKRVRVGVKLQTTANNSGPF